MKQITEKMALSIFLLALLFRLSMVFAMGFVGVPPDGAVYVAQAEGIAHGDGFWYLIRGVKTNLWMAEPGYSFFLAFWMILGVPVGTPMLIVQAVFGACLAPVIYSYVGRHSDRKVAVAAGLLYALDPIAAAPCLFILREIFVLVLVMAAVCAIDMAGKIGIVLKGAFIGLAALSFPIFGLWSIWMWLLDRCCAAQVRKVAIWAVLTAFGVSGIWMARNVYLSDGNYVFRRHITSILVYLTARYDFPWLPDPAAPDFKKILDDVETQFGIQHYTMHNQKEVEAAIVKATVQIFLDDPVTVTWRFMKANFWFWVEVPGAMGLLRSKPALHGILLTFHIIQLMLFAAGMVFLISRAESASFRFVWGTVVYLALFIIPFMPIPRYYVAVLPLIDIVAAYGMVRAVARRVDRHGA